eukprot:gene54984-75342_t
MSDESNAQLDREALLFHSEGRPGKIEIVASKPMATQRDLALAYSPGVAAPAKRALELADIEAAACPKPDVPIESLTRTALHEAGHSVAAVVLGIGRLRGVQIRDDGGSRGVTRIEFDDDYQPTRAQLDDEVTVALS